LSVTASESPKAIDAAAYRFWIPERVRFADLDLQGHVNNKAFTVYAESGRAAFLREIGFWTPDSPRQNVVVRLELDYLRELHYPGEIRVGVRVLKLGRTSFTLGLGIFDGDACAAAVVTVLARIDTRTRATVALDAGERARLTPYLA
jgi:acyl-CoA thioester hydrolase